MRTIIIQGSAKDDGNTNHLVRQIQHLTNWKLINLNNYQIEQFRYDGKYENNIYEELMTMVVSEYDLIILATPVYWYSMSGIMKTFIDRLTDLITINKQIGRQLKGKYLAVITSSSGGNLGEQFWLPFKETANYLGMKYIGNMHTMSNKENDKQIKSFIKLVN